MKLTYFGHSCFSVIVSGKTLLFDPFIRSNELAKHIDVKSIRPDFILISHGHWDHLADAVELAKQAGSTIVSNFEITEWLSKQGAKTTRAMNHGGAWNFEFGRVKLVNAIHSSSLPDGSYGGNPAGFVVQAKDVSFYYSGDTSLTLDMKLIGEMVRLDLAILCIGDCFTMGVEDAIKASELIQCNRVVGVHYDTFSPIKIDHAAAIQKFRSAGKELHLLKIGETQDL